MPNLGNLFEIGKLVDLPEIIKKLKTCETNRKL